MKKSLIRIRAALTMGVMWAMAWLPLGLLIGLIVDPDGSMDEPWIMVGALPGFLGGVAFSVALMVAEARRRFDALSIRRVAGWGALGGLLVGFAPFVLGDRGGEPFPLWMLTIPAAITAMGAVSAAGSLALARKGNLNLIDDSADVADLRVTGGETSRKSE